MGTVHDYNVRLPIGLCGCSRIVLLSANCVISMCWQRKGRLDHTNPSCFLHTTF